MSEKPNSIKEDKVRYGKALGILLKNHFQSPPYKNSQLGGSLYWTPKLFAGALGVTDSAVRQWLRGDELPKNNMNGVIRTLFGSDHSAFADQIAELWKVYNDCVGEQKARYPTTEADGDMTVESRLSKAASGFELYREQNIRLQGEVRTSSHRSAMLLAAEAARCNDLGKPNAALRFALNGWLLTRQAGAPCPEEVEREMVRGARSIRLQSEIFQSLVHATYSSKSGDYGFLASKGNYVFLSSIRDNVEKVICHSFKWLVITQKYRSCIQCIDGFTVNKFVLDDMLEPDCEIKFIFPENGRDIAITDDDSSVWSSPESGMAYCLGSNRFRMWSLRHGNRPIIDVETTSKGFVSISPDGRLMACSIFDNKSTLWKIFPFEKVSDISNLTGIGFEPYTANFSSDSSVLHVKFSEYVARAIYLVDEKIFEIKRSDCDPASRHLLSIANMDVVVRNSLLKVFDRSTGNLVYQQPYVRKRNGGYCVLSSDNKYLVHVQGYIADVYSLASGFNLIYTIPNYGDIEELKLPLSSTIIVMKCRHHDGRRSIACVFSLIDGSELFVTEDCAAFDISDDGKTLAIIGSEDNIVVCYHLEDGSYSKISLDWPFDRISFFSSGKFIITFDSFPRPFYKDIDKFYNACVLDVESPCYNSVNELVKFVCDRKLINDKHFTEEEFSEASFKDIYPNIVDECHRWIG